MKIMFLALFPLLFTFVCANKKLMTVNGKEYVQPQGCIQNLHATLLRIQNNLDGPRINIYKDNHCQKLVNQVYKNQQTTVRGQSVKVDYSSAPHSSLILHDTKK